MDIIRELLENKIVIAAIYILICMLVNKAIGLMFALVGHRRENTIKLSFFKGMVQAFVIIVTVYKIMELSDVLSKFSNAILMSSSLIVVVLGFIFQEGLSNIIHGFILAIFKPFDVGDRIEIGSGSDKLTGYVKSMSLRHTVIRGVSDNAEMLIPNSAMDSATIRNLTTENEYNKYPLIISITYDDAQTESKMKLAKSIISEEILANPLTIDNRKDKTQPLFVKVSLGESAVDLTCFVETATAEDNYVAGSEIKERLLFRFKEADINFAYNHLELSGELSLSE